MFTDSSKRLRNIDEKNIQCPAPLRGIFTPIEKRQFKTFRTRRISNCQERGQAKKLRNWPDFIGSFSDNFSTTMDQKKKRGLAKPPCIYDYQQRNRVPLKYKTDVR